MLCYSKVSFLRRVQSITLGTVSSSQVPSAIQTSEAFLDISYVLRTTVVTARLRSSFTLHSNSFPSQSGTFTTVYFISYFFCLSGSWQGRKLSMKSWQPPQSSMIFIRINHHWQLPIGFLWFIIWCHDFSTLQEFSSSSGTSAMGKNQTIYSPGGLAVAPTSLRVH